MPGRNFRQSDGEIRPIFLRSHDSDADACVGLGCGLIARSQTRIDHGTGNGAASMHRQAFRLPESCHNTDLPGSPLQYVWQNDSVGRLQAGKDHRSKRRKPEASGLTLTQGAPLLLEERLCMIILGTWSETSHLLLMVAFSDILLCFFSAPPYGELVIGQSGD